MQDQFLDTSEFSVAQLVTEAYIPMIARLDNKSGNKLSSGGDDPHIWKAGNLWQAIGALDGINELGQTASLYSPEKARKLLPGEPTVEQYGTFLKSLSDTVALNVAKEGMDGSFVSRERPPLTPWRTVARTWSLTNSLELGIDPQQYEASRFRYDFESVGGINAITKATAIIMLDIDIYDPVKTALVEHIMNQDPSLQDVAGTSEKVTKIIQATIDSRKANLASLEGLRATAHVNQLKREIANHEAMLVGLPDMIQQLGSIDRENLASKVDRKKKQLTKLQLQDIEDSIEFEAANAQHIKDGTPLPPDVMKKVWADSWQFKKEARLVFRFLPTKTERQYLLPDGERIIGE